MRINIIVFIVSFGLAFSACKKDKPAAAGSNKGMKTWDGGPGESGTMYIAKYEFDMDEDGSTDFKISNGPATTPPYPNPGYKWLTIECVDPDAYLLMEDQADTFFHYVTTSSVNSGIPPVDEYEVTHTKCLAPVSGSYTTELADKAYEAQDGYNISFSGNWKQSTVTLYQQDYDWSYGGYSKTDTLVHTITSINTNTHNITDNSTFYLCIKKTGGDKEKFGWIQLTTGTEAQFTIDGYAFEK